MSETIDREIRAIEKQRNDALISGNIDALSNLITDDLVHIHTTGVIDSKTSYLNALATRLRFIRIERPSLSIKHLGNVVVVTGPLEQTLELRGTGQVITSSAVATQVWLRNATGWVQSSFHATRLK